MGPRGFVGGQGSPLRSTHEATQVPPHLCFKDWWRYQADSALPQGMMSRPKSPTRATSHLQLNCRPSGFSSWSGSVCRAGSRYGS